MLSFVAFGFSGFGALGTGVYLRGPKPPLGFRVF